MTRLDAECLVTRLKEVRALIDSGNFHMAAAKINAEISALKTIKNTALDLGSDQRDRSPAQQIGRMAMSEAKNSKPLAVGDWRIMQFGFKDHEWYVYRISREKVLIGKKSWLVSSSMWMDKNEFVKKSNYLGSGRFRWWWNFLPLVNDVICPFTRYR